MNVEHAAERYNDLAKQVSREAALDYLDYIVPLLTHAEMTVFMRLTKED